jgi:hypothetical protein
MVTGAAGNFQHLGKTVNDEQHVSTARGGSGLGKGLVAHMGPFSFGGQKLSPARTEVLCQHVQGT